MKSILIYFYAVCLLIFSYCAMFTPYQTVSLFLGIVCIIALALLLIGSSDDTKELSNVITSLERQTLKDKMKSWN